MQSTDLAYWLVWAMGTALFFGCLAVTWWGLFGDRARGRRRCPRCWYDLSHAPSLTCAECGYTVKRERHMYRVRRRILPALAAALVAALGASWALERAQQRGWAELLPTTVLMTALPLSGGGYGDLAAEIAARLARSQLTDEQVRSLVDRCIKGDRGARPVTVAWERKYGGLLDQCRTMAPDIDLVNARLLQLPARIEITNDRPWSPDAPMCLELDVRDWWPTGTECRVHVTPRWDAAPVTVWRDAMPRPTATFRGQGRSRPYPLILDPPAAGPAVIEVAVDRMVPDPGGRRTEWAPIQRQTVGVDLELTGPIAETLRPDTSPDLDRAMRAAFSDGVEKSIGVRSPVRVWFDRRYTYHTAGEATSVGASVDILCDGVLARRLEIWWSTSPEVNERVGWVVAYEDEDLITRANEEDGRWQLRVRGDPAVALRAGVPTDAYWAGEFTVPLRVRQSRRPAPPKFWWRERIEQVETAASIGSATIQGDNDDRTHAADG